MRYTNLLYCSKRQTEIYAHSTTKIYRRNSQSKLVKPEKPVVVGAEIGKLKVDSPEEYRENEIKIQMLSRNLYHQIFGTRCEKNLDEKSVSKLLVELKKHGIKVGNSPKLEDVKLKLPRLYGANIEEHFFEIGNQQIKPYKSLIETLLSREIPPKPDKWNFKSGWTCYRQTGPCEINFPEEDGLVFDIEVCVNYGQEPIIASALGKQYWYSWVSPKLINLVSFKNSPKTYSLDDLIPLGNKGPKLIVGHNVSYDRARIREQYLIEDNNSRFLDTMSLHVCVSGITSYQRAMLKSKKGIDLENEEWAAKSSLNSLSEVYRLYCQKELTKEPRSIFVNGSLEDIRNDFQNLMGYCSNDVQATNEVLFELFPKFCERFPHPVTLAGMLEIGSAYLPVNSNWKRYINECNLTYEDLNIESKCHLAKRADEACQLMKDNKYKTDLWMWDQDWTVKDIKLKKPLKNVINNINSNTQNKDSLQKQFQYLYDTITTLPARRPLLPGYPAWYKKLCSKPDSDDWVPGPNKIGTGMQVTPKLLSLCWEGYPLHYLKEHGWGFLVPFKSTRPENEDGLIPIQELVKKCPVLETNRSASINESDEALDGLWKDVESIISKKDFYKKTKTDQTFGIYTGTGVWCNVILENCCWFLKLPHKNGPSFRVGNPLAKDFLNKFSENVLSGDGDTTAERVIEIAKMLSYWRNNRDRIQGQIVVWLKQNELPSNLLLSNMDYGAIIPQVVVCGTLTRRAMEPTWMTASNAQRERVGSELRSMIQAPRGYKIVGADVDSQELWIASVLGDASSAGLHGATPLGWMTLSGTKSDGTDMHSITAKAVGISRDHAKVINYARIYGAGHNFAERLLKQFNPTISGSAAKSKASRMFELTKGKRLYFLKDDFKDDCLDKGYSSYEALKYARVHNKSVTEMFTKANWKGGSESAMFNRLEEIAGSKYPKTPFLNCRLSRSLEAKDGYDDQYMPTRVNWVVQSGAVDFLHLMLVTMRWLMGKKVRFCLSFHDELRYLVKDEFAYQAALSMHITNLLTRCFCSYRIGLYDLPQSVAFFTSVEVDTVLRKESSMDCRTPSNPHGLEVGYSIEKGESLDIHKVLEKTNCKDMLEWM